MDVRKAMKVESARQEGDRVTVQTTGARFVFQKTGERGRISCTQRLNRERLVATVELSRPLGNLSIQHVDEERAVLHQDAVGCGYLRLAVGRDSSLELYCLPELSVSIQGSFRPDCCSSRDGHVLLIDEIGGFGAFPYQGLRHWDHVDAAQAEWKVAYDLDGYARLYLSVFPPRRFETAQSFDERIVHHGSIGPWTPPPYPTDAMIEEFSRYGNVLVLHEMLWQGKLTREGKPIASLDDLLLDACFCTHDYVAVDERELERVVATSHRRGMKVIPYMSPNYSTARGREFLDRVKAAIGRFGFDGVYYDGISQDIAYSHDIIRGTRDIVGDGVIYCHEPNPFRSRHVYCPFIDTWADYLLRAEGFTGFTDRFLRYVVSGYNISNAIGYICYYFFPAEFIMQIMDKALAAHARFYLGSPETELERLLKREYFPRLAAARKALDIGGVAASDAAPPARGGDRGEA